MGVCATIYVCAFFLHLASVHIPVLGSDSTHLSVFSGVAVPGRYGFMCEVCNVCKVRKVSVYALLMKRRGAHHSG